MTLVLLILCPVGFYYVVGWQWREKDIAESMSVKAKVMYFDKFRRLIVSNIAVEDTFQSFYRSWSGKNRLLIATVMLLIPVAVQGYFVGELAISKLLQGTAAQPPPGY